MEPDAAMVRVNATELSPLANYTVSFWLGPVCADAF